MRSREVSFSDVAVTTALWEDFSDADKEHQELWVRWCQDKDLSAREKLFAEYAWLIKVSAAKIIQRKGYLSPEYKDCLQAGSVALLESLDRFRPYKKVPFAHYAKKRIVGAIHDGISKNSELAQRVIDISKQKVRVDSIANNSGDEADELQKIIDITVGLAIGFLLEEDPEQLPSEDLDRQPYRSAELASLKRKVSYFVGTLPQQQAYVLRSHYFHEISFKQIAEGLGLSRSRVSQIHAAALSSIRASVDDNNISPEKFI